MAEISILQLKNRVHINDGSLKLLVSSKGSILRFKKGVHLNLPLLNLPGIIKKRYENLSIFQIRKGVRINHPVLHLPGIVK